MNIGRKIATWLNELLKVDTFKAGMSHALTNHILHTDHYKTYYVVSNALYEYDY